MNNGKQVYFFFTVMSVWCGHLSLVPQAFQDIEILKTHFQFERNVKTGGVEVPKSVHPYRTGSYAGLTGHENFALDKRFLTETLRCSGSGCDPNPSCVKYKGCSVIVNVVHTLQNVNIFVKGSHGNHFKPGSGKQRGLSDDVSFKKKKIQTK
jgi:hypothetical protein